MWWKCHLHGQVQTFPGHVVTFYPWVPFNGVTGAEDWAGEKARSPPAGRTTEVLFYLSISGHLRLPACSFIFIMDHKSSMKIGVVTELSWLPPLGDNESWCWMIPECSHFLPSLRTKHPWTLGAPGLALLGGEWRCAFSLISCPPWAGQAENPNSYP